MRQTRLSFDQIGQEPSRSAAKLRQLDTVGLFAGVGGIERGLAAAGHVPLLFSEVDVAAVSVLENRFRGVPIHRDVATLEALPREADLVAAGFPCQDLSPAGPSGGIDGDKSGLVGHVFRLLRVRSVPWVLLENVPFMLQLQRGRALDLIVSELEKLSYRWAYRVVDTRAFGLPQRRERVFLVASLEEDPRTVLFVDEAFPPDDLDSSELLSDDVAYGFYWTEGTRGVGWTVNGVPTLKGGSSVGIPSPPAILLPHGDVVTPDIRDAERLQGFPKGWTRAAEKVARRGVRWKLVGNAVSVPVARWLGARLACPGSIENVRIRCEHRLADGVRWPLAAWNVGEGRFGGTISTWPKAFSQRDLVDFLSEEPRLLSERATRGFFQRASSSSLRFAPGFLEAIRGHLERVSPLGR